MKVVERINPKRSHHKGNFFSISLFLYERMDVHFMMCVSQIIIQYCMSVISQYNRNKNTLKKICQCLCPIHPGLVAKGFMNCSHHSRQHKDP